MTEPLEELTTNWLGLRLPKLGLMAGVSNRPETLPDAEITVNDWLACGKNDSAWLSARVPPSVTFPPTVTTS